MKPVHHLAVRRSAILTDGTHIGGSETIYYYQPQCRTEFSEEIFNSLIFTLAFNSSVKVDNISSFKWGKDKKWFSLGSLVLSENELMPNLIHAHYSYNFSKVTLFFFKYFPFKIFYNSLVFSLIIWYVYVYVFWMWLKTKQIESFSPFDVLERTEIKREKAINHWPLGKILVGA